MTESEIIEQKHLGGVTSRTSEFCRLAEPVTVNIEGREVGLSLSDAARLSKGLADAIQRVQQAERTLTGDGSGYTTPLLATPGSGMSMPQSKLG